MKTFCWLRKPDVILQLCDLGAKLQLFWDLSYIDTYITVLYQTPLSQWSYIMGLGATNATNGFIYPFHIFH